MKMSRFHDSRRVMRVLRAAPACAWGGPVLAAIVLAACSGEADPSASIARARNTLTALSSGGAAAPPAPLIEKSAGDVASDLGQIGSGDSPSVAMAHSLAAQALGAQGLVAADRYRGLDAELLRAVTGSQATLNLYRQQRALSEASKGYDPAGEIEAFDSQIAEQKRDREMAQRELDANQAKVAQLRNSAKSMRANARKESEAEASLRAEALSADAQRRLQLVSDATALRRKSDLILKQADVTDAQAARIEPEAEEIRLRIVRAESRVAALERAKQRAADLARSRQEESARSAEGASKTATLLGANLKEVCALLDEQVSPAFEDAIKRYESAVSKISSARDGGARATAQAAIGGLVQSAAALHRERSESLRRVATLLEQAAAAPDLPERDVIGRDAASIREQSKASAQTAMEGYDRARTAFESAGGGTGGINEQFQFLALGAAAMYERLGGKREAPVVDPEQSPSEPESAEPQPDDSGEPQPAPEGEPPPEAEPQPQGEPQPSPGA